MALQLCEHHPSVAQTSADPLWQWLQLLSSPTLHVPLPLGPASGMGQTEPSFCPLLLLSRTRWCPHALSLLKTHLPQMGPAVCKHFVHNHPWSQRILLHLQSPRCAVGLAKVPSWFSLPFAVFKSSLRVNMAQAHIQVRRCAGMYQCQAEAQSQPWEGAECTAGACRGTKAGLIQYLHASDAKYSPRAITLTGYNPAAWLKNGTSPWQNTLTTRIHPKPWGLASIYRQDVGHSPDCSLPWASQDEQRGGQREGRQELASRRHWKQSEATKSLGTKLIYSEQNGKISIAVAINYPCMCIPWHNRIRGLKPQALMVSLKKKVSKEPNLIVSFKYKNAVHWLSGGMLRPPLKLKGKYQPVFRWIDVTGFYSRRARVE